MGTQRKDLTGLLTILVLAMCSFSMLPGADAQTAQMPSQQASATFIAAADTYVSEASPSTNYGTASALWVDGGSGTQQESYLRFTVTNLDSPVQRAVLRVYVTSNGTGNGPAVYATGSGWTESGLTWSTRPARSGGGDRQCGGAGDQ